MEIEVGEYVRTKKGQIDKLCAILGYEDDKDVAIARCKNKKFWLEDIVKHSKNITDLIEEGDFVNGLKVYKGKVASGKEKLLVGNHLINGMSLEVVNIKSIVTKEQFASVEYRLEKE